ncbi:MAG: hypothetical protein AB7O96_19940 [Pseudobdellovibrionaceae bacterium]
MQLPNLIFSAVILFGSSIAMAFEKEVIARTGVIVGAYETKVNKGTFSAPTVFEGEFQFIADPKMAWSFRGTLAMDTGNSRSRYLYAGAGQRYFFGAAANPVESTYGGDFISIKPKHQFYGGWDAGVGQVLIVEFGDLIGTYATCVEMGMVAGYKYRWDKQFSMEASFGYNYGLSIITISAATQVIRGLFGFTYLF